MPLELPVLIASVLQEYEKCHGLRLVPVQIDHLKPMIEQRGFADRIVWEEYKFQAKYIAAQVSFYEAALGLYAGDGNYARIQFSESLNFCWKRFVVCKEMMHCILDASQERRVQNMDDLMKLSESLVDDVTSRIKPFPPFETETYAEICALEVLFPYELRLTYKERYELGEISDYQLALRYKIPEKYVRLAMYPNYMDTIKELRGAKLVSIEGIDT